MTGYTHTANGAYFAQDNAGMTDSLFTGRTATGYAVMTAEGIRFEDMQRTPRAFLCRRPIKGRPNSGAQSFFVSCRRQSDGRIRYMQSTTSADERWLGIDELGYGAKLELADRIIRNTYQ